MKNKIKNKPFDLSKNQNLLEKTLEYDLVYAGFKQRQKQPIPRFLQERVITPKNNNKPKVKLELINKVYKNEVYKSILRNDFSNDLQNQYKNYYDALKKLNTKKSQKNWNNFKSTETKILKALGIDVIVIESRKDKFNKVKIKYRGTKRGDLLAYKQATDSIKKVGVKVVGMDDINKYQIETMEEIRMNLIKLIKKKINRNNPEQLSKLELFIKIINSPDKIDSQTPETLFLQALQFGFKL